MSTLFHRIGGEAALRAAVPRFYEKVLADDLIASMFEGLDIAKTTAKQISFLARAFGGPDAYAGRDLRIAHAYLVRGHGLADAHFDRTVRLLDETLDELGIGPDLRVEVGEMLESTRDEVLGR